MDGQFDKLEELIYVESHLSNTSAKFYGEITQQMLKNSSFPGSNNGTGLLQTIIGLKVRTCCCLLLLFAAWASRRR
jgi:phosphoribulokinase